MPESGSNPCPLGNQPSVGILPLCCGAADSACQSAWKWKGVQGWGVITGRTHGPSVRMQCGRGGRGGPREGLPSPLGSGGQAPLKLGSIQRMVLTEPSAVQEWLLPLQGQQGGLGWWWSMVCASEGHSETSALQSRPSLCKHLPIIPRPLSVSFLSLHP